MVVAIITILLDSQIGYVADFIPEQLSSSGGVTAFVVIAVIFAITQYFILAYVKQSDKGNKARSLNLDLTYWIVSVAQYVLAGILAFAILQIIITQQYSIVTLYVSYAISYGLWIVILGLLARALFSWYRLSNRNIMVLILALSMIAYVINGITGLATVSDMLAQQKPVVTSNDIGHFPEFSIATLGSQISIIYQIVAGIAYVLTWVGTVKLLHPYIMKLGKFKFWTIMGVAMAYYLIEFPLFVLGYFTPSENVDAMTNIIIFSFGAILTGIIFGVSVPINCKNFTKRKRTKKPYANSGLWISSLLYCWISISWTQGAYPPFGLASVSLTGLSCYLIYSGLYSSATSVSQDANLRQYIRRSVTEQSRLLDSMGTAQMEQELQSRVLIVTKKLSDKMEEESGVESSLTEVDIKEHIEMVRNEFKRIKSGS